MLVLSLTACTGSDPAPRAAATSTPTREPVEPLCPNQDAVVEDEAFRTATTTAGDVDGDGTEEEVALHFDPAGAPGCKAFVVAGPLVGRIGTWSAEFGLPMPTLNSLRQIDGEPGEDVVVNMGIGASTQFVGVLVHRDGELVQVTSDVRDQPNDGMFGFGGSVGHLEAVDCLGGRVVSSFATPHADGYRVQRRFLAFRGTTLVEERTDVQEIGIEDVGRLPEYEGSPFGSCPSN